MSSRLLIYVKKGAHDGMRPMTVSLSFTLGALIAGFFWDNFDPAMSFYSTFSSSSFILILLLKE